MLPCEDIAILHFNQYQKSDKVPFINYADYKCLIETFDGRKYNLKNSSTTKGILSLNKIVIKQENIEVLQIAHVIQNIVYLKKLPQFFTMDVTIIIILS